MNKTLYDMMNWADVEEVVYSESTNPERILGLTKVSGGVMIQAFFPNAKSVTVVEKSSSKFYKMECADEAGFFAVFLPKKRKFGYTYDIQYEDKTLHNVEDLYSFTDILENDDIKRFESGDCSNSYEFMGARPTEINKVKGTAFAVYAPNAMRVSVIGDFNNFDGRNYQMMKLGASGIFELFIPGAKAKDKYLFEIKDFSGKPFTKTDPYAKNIAFVDDKKYSVIESDDNFIWQDAAFIDKRSKYDSKTSPLNALEVHLESFLGRKKTSYPELAEKIIETANEFNFTHIFLMPMMEYSDSSTCGYLTESFFTPSDKFGSPKEFKVFVNMLHKAGLFVILDWNGIYFPKSSNSIYLYDGKPTFESTDPSGSKHPYIEAVKFDFTNPKVCSFILSNAFYLAKNYHIDGLNVNSLEYASSTEVFEFFAKFNQLLHDNFKGFTTTTQEAFSYSGATLETEEGGLGFDFKLNDEFKNNIMNYTATDFNYRRNRHELLTDNILFAFGENYILPISHTCFEKSFGALPIRVPGNERQKEASLKLLLAYTFLHPGKKLLFMGLAKGNNKIWSPTSDLDYSVIKNKEFAAFTKDLTRFYLDHPVLFDSDQDLNSFEFISHLDQDHSMITFTRKSTKSDEVLFVIMNFAPIMYDSFLAGVPFEGIYTEIFNSDLTMYNGNGHTNERVLSKEIEWDAMENSINVCVPPLSVLVFSAKKIE